MKSKDPIKDLHRLLDKQNFKNEEEIKEFMNSIMLKPLPEIGEEELSKEQRAQDLVEEAYDLPIREAMKNIDVALNFNPDCIEAYEYLGSVQRRIDSALSYYEKGIEIGRRIFGGKYLEKNRGHFWGIHETRPYMRCLFEYADLLYMSGKKEKGVEMMKEIILLNPNDNQGVRDQLMLYLIEQNEFEQYEFYSNMYPVDGGAFTHFNRALFAFKRKGDNDYTSEILKNAVKENIFVIPLIISSKIQSELPDSYGIGDKHEAKYYAVYAQRIWHQTPGAIKWMMKFRHAD